MGIIFMDGFEKGVADRWTLSGALVADNALEGMSGNYLLNFNGLSKDASLALPTSYSALYMTFRLNLSSAQAILYVKDSGGTTIMSLGCNVASHALELYRGAGLVATGNVLPIDQTVVLKIYHYPKNSGGSFILSVDGEESINYSGDTTAGLENIASLAWGATSGSVNTIMSIDDLVISTTDITKNLRIAGKAVTGAGTTTQWDPSTGSNYQCVDEVPPVHTDYNSTNTTDEIDTFAIANCTEEIDNIEAVQVELSCAYEGTPTPTHLQAVLRCGSTNYPSGVDASPPASFGIPIVQIWSVNPDDSAAFAESDINAMEIGYKATA